MSDERDSREAPRLQCEGSGSIDRRYEAKDSSEVKDSSGVATESSSFA
jgi:hypothetical protein